MHSGCTKDVLADEAGLMIEEDIRPNEPTGDSNRMSCEHTIWTVNDVPISLFSFCGDISHEKTPKILIQSFWGVFPGEMQPQKQGGPDYVLSSQTEKLMAGTKFSDYLGLNHYKKAKKLKHFIHLGLAQGPQSFVTYLSISPAGNSGYQLKNHVLVM